MIIVICTMSNVSELKRIKLSSHLHINILYTEGYIIVELTYTHPLE